MKIEILGTGCSKCKKTEQLVRKVIEELQIQADIVRIKDLEEIIDRGVIMTPAVIIDGEAKIVGHVPKEEELKKLLSS